MAQKPVTSTLSPALSPKTGAVIPLGAIRSTKAIGEFADLVEFAEFCNKADLKIIQLLPVNDSGTGSSPYSALSAFALNPIYLTLEDIPEFADTPQAAARVKKLHTSASGLARFPYRDIRNEKAAILRLIYEENQAKIANSTELTEWIASNEWIASYAVYMAYKNDYMEASWKEWPDEARDSSPEDILSRWNDKKLWEKHLFFAWVQMNADTQFKKATDEVKALGIMLKGDIPILMAEDSCDVWAYPDYFDNAMRAGAPPDMYSANGQSWGFPVYKWDNLAKDGYSWWKDRLKSAARYYEAYRIDHILGFFRIWQSPETETTASLGRPDPLAPITKKELLAAGFDDGRVRWLSEPHIPTRAVEDANNGDYLGTHGILRTLADRIGDEELWLFKENLAGDKAIYNADIPQGVKNVLAWYWTNRTLIKTGKDEYSICWNHRDSIAWKSLADSERAALEALFAKKNKEQEKLWETHARTILETLVKSTPMIPCAEDLGVELESVPAVLSDLGILSLRVVRWARDWGKEGYPYYPFESYPALSVAATSVHDSSTLRGWWEKENDGVETPSFVNRKGIATDSPYTAKTAECLLGALAENVNSVFCIYPMQDLLGLVDTYNPANPDDERVNLPGTVTDFNWTYRLPVPVKTLLKDKDLITRITHLSELHAKK